jgi:hypothetical protein
MTWSCHSATSSVPMSAAAVAPMLERRTDSRTNDRSVLLIHHPLLIFNTLRFRGTALYFSTAACHRWYSGG